MLSADLFFHSAHNMVIQYDSAQTTATCSTSGTIRKECSYCNWPEISKGKLPNQHPTDKLKTETKADTCVKDGYTKITCTACRTEISNQVEKAHGKHTTASKPRVETAPTCTKKGTLVDWCTVCDKTLGFNSYIDVTGHKPEEYDRVEPTCCEPGTAEIRCTVCNELLKTETLAATGHGDVEGKDYEWRVTKEPTCTENGVETKYCLNTGDSMGETRAIPATGHQHLAVIPAVPATPDQPGKTEGPQDVSGENTLISGAEDYAICPNDNYPLSQWIPTGDGNHVRVCTCATCDYSETAACVYFEITVNDVLYKICPICGHFGDEQYKHIRNVKVGVDGHLHELICRAYEAPFGAEAATVKNYDENAVVIADSFTAVKSVKGELMAWGDTETLYIPMPNPGKVTLVSMDMEGNFENVPFMYFDGRIAFNAEDNALYLIITK